MFVAILPDQLKTPNIMFSIMAKPKIDRPIKMASSTIGDPSSFFINSKSKTLHVSSSVNS